MINKNIILEKFKQLGLGFMNNDPKLQLIDDEKKELSKKVDNFIDNKMVEVILSYIESGYELTAKQKKVFFDNLNALSTDESFSIFNRVIQKGIKISDDVALLGFFLFTEEICFFREKDSSVINFYDEKLKDKNFIQKIYEQWFNNLNILLEKNRNDKDYHEKFSNSYTFIDRKVVIPFRRYGEDLFKHQNLEDYSEAMTKINQLIKKYQKPLSKSHDYSRVAEFKFMLEKIELYISAHCNDEIAEHKKKIGVLYDNGELDKLVAEENIKFGSQEQVKNLPIKAKEVLEQIKVDYLSLNKKLADLTEEERFNIDNLWSKRIPEILNKYLRADPEFRATMKNSKGESIEDLLVTSLRNIHDILNKMQETHTKSMLNDMSALTNYTNELHKSVKMSF